MLGKYNVPMRICLVSREYPPDTGWGGVGAYTFQMANGLAARGHEVHVISLAGKNAGDSTIVCAESGITIHRAAWEDLLDELNLFLVSAPSTHFIVKTGIALWRKYISLHREKSFDVVEVPEHLAGGFFQTTTGIAPVVIKLHTPHSKFVTERFHAVLPSFDNQIICLLERVAMNAADVLCSPSQDLANFVASDTGVDPKRIEIIRNPVDIERFCPEGAKALDASQDCTILFVGRLEERKGINYLIDAIPHAVRTVSAIRFVVIGADTNTAPGGTSMLAHLKDRLRTSGCEGKVQFIPHVPLSEMPNYYRCADVCVIPSLYDNAPYTCIEAMSSGKPVVVSSAGGTKEYVQPEWGYVVEPRQSDELAAVLAKLAVDRELRLSMGANARKFVEHQLSRETIAIQMERLYEDAINNFRARGRKMYEKPAVDALPDALQLLCAYDQMMFEVLSAQSLTFRLRHYMRFARKRPSLFAATVLLETMRKALKLVGKTEDLPFMQKLARQIDSKQPPRYSNTMKVGDIVGQTSPIHGIINDPSKVR